MENTTATKTIYAIIDYMAALAHYAAAKAEAYAEAATAAEDAFKAAVAKAKAAAKVAEEAEAAYAAAVNGKENEAKLETANAELHALRIKARRMDDFVPVCAVCGLPIAATDESHWGHETTCQFYGHVEITDEDGCDCDVSYHPECCPECAIEDARDEEEEATE